MESYTRSEREEYNIMRDKACAQLGITKSQYNAFRRLAERLTVTDTQYCNGEYPYAEADGEFRYDHKASAIYDAIEAKLGGLHYYHQSDPRGRSLYVSKEPMDSDSYTSGVVIY